MISLPDPYSLSLWWRLSAAFLLFFFFAVQKVRAYNRLKAFNGPFLAGWTEAWHAWAILGFKSHLKYDAVCRKYGTIARVGPNDLVTSSPELLVHMNGVRSRYTRTEWFYRACRHRPDKDHVFSEMDEEKHRQLRQQMGSGQYSGKENEGLEDSVDTHVSELVRLIRSKYASTEAAARPMDFARKIQYLTLDVISDISFGKAFGDLRADEDVLGIAESSEAGIVVFTYGIALGLYKILHRPLFARLLGPKETDATGWGRMFANGRAIVRERLALEAQGGEQRRSDMIASFIRHGLAEEEILSETTLQMIAGSDTTAASLRTIMLYLMTHPRVYAKLQAEIDASATAAAGGSVVSDARCRGLPYLQAVIREGMRVHPPVTNMDPKRVPDGGDTVVVDGETVFLPGGTNVSCAAWPLHINEDVFGRDAGAFRPERWLLERSEGRLARMHRVHELMFGYGKYQCLGRPIAMMEIGKTVYEVSVRSFR
ncbi:Pisatin demethylase, partial [Colletotrichum tanaceti]